MTTTIKQLSSFKDVLHILQTQQCQTTSPDALQDNSIQQTLFQIDTLFIGLHNNQSYDILSLIIGQQMLFYAKSTSNLSVRTQTFNLIFNCVSEKFAKSNDQKILTTLKNEKLKLFIKTLSIAISVYVPEISGFSKNNENGGLISSNNSNSNYDNSLNFIISSVQVMRYLKISELRQVGEMLTKDVIIEGLQQRKNLSTSFDKYSIVENFMEKDEANKYLDLRRSANCKFKQIGVKIPIFAVMVTALILEEKFMEEIISSISDLSILGAWLDVINYWIFYSNRPGGPAGFVYSILIHDERSFKNKFLEEQRNSQKTGYIELCPINRILLFLCRFIPKYLSETEINQVSGLVSPKLLATFNDQISQLFYLLQISIDSNNNKNFGKWISRSSEFSCTILTKEIFEKIIESFVIQRNHLGSNNFDEQIYEKFLRILTVLEDKFKRNVVKAGLERLPDHVLLEHVCQV